MLHKRFDFTQSGGFPFTQEVLAYMQESYSELAGVLAGLIGENMILSGVHIVSNYISAGWIVCDGEVLPFEAGAYTGWFEITTASTALVFESGASKSVKFSRYARPAASGINFNSLQRITPVGFNQFAVIGDGDSGNGISYNLKCQRLPVGLLISGYVLSYNDIPGTGVFSLPANIIRIGNYNGKTAYCTARLIGSNSKPDNYFKKCLIQFQNDSLIFDIGAYNTEDFTGDYGAEVIFTVIF